MIKMDRELPKVSVIIPVFNGENYLREAIDSVLAQTYKNFELLVVDDGSNDGTWDMIQSYGSRLYGIRKKNGGVASALNCGIQQASGDYIAWLSHDDLFLPDKLERQVEFLIQFPQFIACYTDYYIIDENGNVIQEIETPWFPRQEAIRALFARSYINGSTMVIERSCFETVGLFSETLRYTQDIEMWLRLLEHFEIGRVSEKLLKWRSHPSQGSRNVSPHLEEAQAMFKQVFERMEVTGIFPEYGDSARSPKTVAKAYTWLGDTMAFHRAWYGFAEEQYKRAIEIDPSWGNPARLKKTLNPIWRTLRIGYRRLRDGFRERVHKG